MRFGSEMIFGKRLKRPFQPPFPWLPVVIWVFFVVSTLAHPEAQIWHYNFIDNDDYLYLVQAIDQLHGQNWFDVLQHRIAPPSGTLVHFSRLLSGFYAIPILILRPWLGTLNAATVTAAIIPLIYLAGLLAALRWVAVIFVGKEWANLTAFGAIFCLSLMLQFSPGRLDHHGLEALFAVLGFGFTTRLMRAPSDIQSAFAGGLTFAIALAFGLEILPVILTLGAVLGLWVVIGEKREATGGFFFSLSLFLGSVAFLCLSVPPERLFDTRVDDYSITYVILTAGMASAFAVALIIVQLNVSVFVRRFLTISFVILLAGGFMLLFPSLQSGPYGGVDPQITKLIFFTSSEAWPLYSGGPYARSIALPLIALVGCYQFFERHDKALNWPSALLTSLLFVTLALAIFYQERFMVFAEAFCVAPVIGVAQKAWNASLNRHTPIVTSISRIVILLFVGPLTVILIPALVGFYASPIDLLFFPTQVHGKICDNNGLIDVLDKKYGDRQLLLINSINESVELLFRTKSAVLAAPYHENREGNLSAYAFFTASTSADAEMIAKKTRADLVVFCSPLSPIYLSAGMHRSEDGLSEKFFIEQLNEGIVPSWLEEIKSPKLGNIHLFEIKED